MLLHGWLVWMRIMFNALGKLSNRRVLCQADDVIISSNVNLIDARLPSWVVMSVPSVIAVHDNPCVYLNESSSIFFVICRCVSMLCDGGMPWAPPGITSPCAQVRLLLTNQTQLHVLRCLLRSRSNMNSMCLTSISLL